MFKKDHTVLDFRTKEQKREEFKMKAKRKLDGTIQWIRENQDVLIIVAPVVTVVAGKTIGLASNAIKLHRTNKEIDYKERMIYDHSLGKYAELKKPLTAVQALTVEERRANGEKLHTILNDMGLLKK